MCRMILALAVLAASGAAGCSSERCQGDLADVGAGCPPTFDGTAAQLPACPTFPLTYVARLCGDLISLEAMSISGGGCYYDASSHELVGAAGGTDIRTFCGGTSYDIYAGRIAGSCMSEPLATKDCRSQP